MGHAALLDSISQDRKDARRAAGERDKKAKERVQRLYQKDKERKQQAAQQVAVKRRAGRPHLTYVPPLEPPEALPGTPDGAAGSSNSGDGGGEGAGSGAEEQEQQAQQPAEAPQRDVGDSAPANQSGEQQEHAGALDPFGPVQQVEAALEEVGAKLVELVVRP